MEKKAFIEITDKKIELPRCPAPTPMADILKMSFRSRLWEELYKITADKDVEVLSMDDNLVRRRILDLFKISTMDVPIVAEEPDEDVWDRGAYSLTFKFMNWLLTGAHPVSEINPVSVIRWRTANDRKSGTYRLTVKFNCPVWQAAAPAGAICVGKHSEIDGGDEITFVIKRSLFRDRALVDCFHGIKLE